MPLFKKEKIVYYPGCLTKFKLKKQFELYKKILGKLKIDFIVLDEFLCCGNKIFDLGYETEARKLARRNLKIFKDNKINKVITNCPECYKFFSQNCREMMPDWDIEIEHILITILKKLEKIKITKEKEKIGYHDNCYLGRYSKLYNEPRDVLNLLGYEIVEFKENKKNADCCGACGALPMIDSELAGKIAENLIKKAKYENIDKIVTVGECYLHLKDIAKEKGIEIFEISEIIAKALDIGVEEENENEAGERNGG